MRAAIILLSLLCTVAPARAQAPGVTPPRNGSGPGAAQLENRREKIKKRIRALRAYTLTEELDLDEQTAGKLFPILGKYDDDFDKLLQQRADIMRRLDGAKAMKDPRAIDRVIDEAVANQRGFWDLDEKRLVELRKVLAPAQTARLLIVLPALERKIENQLRNAIRPGKGAGAGSANNDDDDIEPDERPKPKRPCDPFSSKRC